MKKIEKGKIPDDKIKKITGYIFPVLTQGTYTTFTKALREVVSNSFDAGAHEIKITFEPENLLQIKNPKMVQIQIKDDGFGMTGDEFMEQFASIASPTKNPEKLDKITKRYPIGKFGIGALALMPFAKKFTVYSKKYNENPIKCRLYAEKIINGPFEKEYTEHIKENMEAKFISEESWIEVYGSKDSGTIIYIDGIHEDVYRYIMEGSRDLWVGTINIYKDATHLTKGLKEIAWDLSTILPLEYEEDDGEVYKKHKKYLQSNNPPIKVIFSGIELKRKIFSQKNCKVTRFDYNDKKTGVVAKGVLVSNPGPTVPNKANGIMMRINNVGIGGYSFHTMRYGQRVAESRITGELHILKGMHTELANNREAFNEYSTQYINLIKKLDVKFKEACSDSVGLSEKKVKRKKDEQKKEIVSNYIQIKSKNKVTDQPPPKPPSTKTTTDTITQTSNQKKGHRDKIKTESEKKEKDKVEQAENGKEFTDPIIDIKENKGSLNLDPNHPIFKEYNKSNETETITRVLLALKLVEVPLDTYKKIIQILIKLKKGV